MDHVGRDHVGRDPKIIDQESDGEQNAQGSIAPKDTVIVFDWDDTILPTSWLERLHALTAAAPMRPEIQRQIASLCAVCAQTIIAASRLGKVIIITNSAPGWVDQSCQLFMPQLAQQARSLQIFAKPMGAPLTFKVGSFKRECKAFKNVISIGDGDAERTASLRLQSPAHRKNFSMLGSEPAHVQRVKSIKFADMPSCQQLICQHEMLLSRLVDVVRYDGNLDLKSRLCCNPQIVGSFKSDDVTCQLVHFNQPARELQTVDTTVGGRGGLMATSQQQQHVHEDSGTHASGRMHALLSARGQANPPLSPHRERVGQLPALNGLAAERTDLSSHSPGLARGDGDMGGPSWKVQGISDTSGTRSPYHGLANKKTGLAPPFGRNGPLATRTPQAVRS
jgi:hypothetical protein